MEKKTTEAAEIILKDLDTMEISNLSVKKPRKPIQKGKSRKYIVKGRSENMPCLISKPEQGKKTIETTEIVEVDIDKNKNVLNIYIAQNRINQVNKAAENFMEFILKKRGITELSILHGQRDNSTDPDGYIYRAINKDCRLIAGLANPTRLKIIKNIIIQWLSHNKCNIVKVYCDEAQKTFPLFMKHVYTKLHQEILCKVYPILIDAHAEGIISDPMYKKHFNGMINKLENKYDLSNYLFMSSMPFVNMDWRKSDDILASYVNGNLDITIKDYILWPLSYKKVNQYDFASIIVSTIPNTCVLIINGDAFHVYKPDGFNKTFTKKNCKTKSCWEDTCSTCFPELNNSEFKIVQKIKGTYAKDKTFILTGHQCIERAMTYFTPDMPFTKSFIASDTVIVKSFFDKEGKKWNDCSIIKQEDISQMLKRSCGSYKKEFEERGIPLPSFYGPKDIYDGVCGMEDVSKRLASMTGVVDQELLDNIKGCNSSSVDLTKISTKTLADLEQPEEYYYHVFDCNNMNPNDIQHILSEYRTKIGGERVTLKTITSRLNPNENNKDVTGKYIEDISKTPLRLNDFKISHDIIKAALNEETKSRVRICYDDESGNPYFVIVWTDNKRKFMFNNEKFNFIKIEEDGNCLLKCFNKSNITTKSVSRLRSDAASHIEDNIDNYAHFIENYNAETASSFIEEIRKNGEWNTKIANILTFVLAEILEVNVHIYDFNTNLASGGEEILFNEPKVIPQNKKYNKNIYLKQCNSRHYDLFEKIYL